MYSEPIIKRFTERIMYTGDCIVWTGYLTNGYGRVKIAGRTLGAHRVAWEIDHGPIPEGLVIDHLCRNRCCVNAAHLRVCTHKQNILAPGSLALARQNILREHCPKGHEYKPYSYGRACRTCGAMATARWKVRKKEKAC